MTVLDTTPVIIPAQRTASPRVRRTTAEHHAAALAFLADDGRAQRFLAHPRRCACSRAARPCPPCATVLGLARRVCADWLASTDPTTVAHRVLPSGATRCGRRPAGTTGWVTPEPAQRRCVLCATVTWTAAA